MIELRNKNTCFQATKSERERIEKVLSIIKIKKSDYIRNIVMKDVEKHEKKMKSQK